ncbi:MAG: IclR family transcriptional regulator [bacterium]|nr:IclR family transcriptional regulator [bacterium]
MVIPLSGTAGNSDSVPGSGRGVAAIERAVDVLFLFSRSSSTLGVTEISRELGVSKAVVHRILTSLCERGLLIVDPESRRYALGPAVLELAAAYRDQLDVRDLALEEMRRLSAETDETATLSVRHGNRRVYVAQITPPREVKMTVPIGGSFPLHAGASSKAFLAWLSDGEIDHYLAENPLDSLTEATIVSVDELRAELDRIRQQGFAVSLGERQHDAGSVAAPILDHNHQPVAVISISGPLERFRDKIARSAAAVVEATRGLSTKLGARPTN